MAIDLRANVSCSLGEVISGSIGDDYIQNNGLIKTTGSVVINDLITPAIGTIVTFNYVKDGVNSSIPRKLRVKSSFADPFRRTTQVELGCKLDYLSDLRPAPTVNGDEEAETGKRRECLNGYINFDKNSEYGIPISAADMAQVCLTKLGISAANAIPLTSKFYRDVFDFSSGYVSVLSDLLLSESYCGYLNESENLAIINLTMGPSSGPVVTSDDIIDIGPIGVGDMPGDAVVVRYEALKLKEDLEDEDPASYDQRNWTEDETIGDSQTTYIRYQPAGGNTLETSFSYVPYSIVTSEYGEDNSWDDDTCVIYDSNGEGADLSDTVIRRVTRTNVLKALAASDYCAQLLGAGLNPFGGEEGETVTTETFQYDNDGQLTLQTTVTEEPFFSWAGRLGIGYLFDSGALILSAYPSVITSKTVTQVTTLYASLPTYISLKPGETYKRVINGQKTVTSQYVNAALLQQGEQGVAGIKEFAPFLSAAELQTYLYRLAGNLVLEKTTVQTARDRTLIGIDRRPAQELRLGGGDGSRGEYRGELLYVTGSASGKRIIELSIPYSPDDCRSSTGAIIKGDAESVINRYGRVQNRLLLGNRSGMSLQLAPEKLPTVPFSPIYVQLNGLTAQYRVNAANWTFDSNGIICSTDALFWGAVGGTGTFWFPVAPGIVTLPETPPVVDGEMSPTSLVPVYNEVAIYDSRIKIGAAVTKFNYALNLLTTLTSTLKVLANAYNMRPIYMPAAADFSVGLYAPRALSSLSLRPGVVDVVISPATPQVGYGIGKIVAPPAVTIVVAAGVPQIGGGVGVPGTAFSIEPLAPEIQTV
jgi:hypothetical protein